MIILIQLGIEPAIFGFVAHCLNQLLLCVPPPPPVTPLGTEPTTFRLVSDSTGNPTRGIPTCRWTHWEDNPRHYGLSVTSLGIETTTFRLETNCIKINLCFVRLKKCDLLISKLKCSLTDWYEWSFEFLQLMGLFLLAERLWAFKLG